MGAEGGHYWDTSQQDANGDEDGADVRTVGGRRLAAERERDAAQGMAARLAHVLHVVDRWVAEKAEPTGQAYRRDLRRLLDSARDERQFVDPYARAAVLEEQNTQMRGVLVGSRGALVGLLALVGDIGPAARVSVTRACEDIDRVLAELDPSAPDKPTE